MSGNHFHVHGPRDHELEHATQSSRAAHGHTGGSMTNKIAMFTAIIATVGALL